MYQSRQNVLLESVTLTLLLANVAVFVVVDLGGDQMLFLLAQTGDLFFSGAYWQPLTAMFVHFDIFHIGFNMIALYYFGRLNEIGYTRRQYLAIYFAAGLVGNVASLFLIPLDTPTGGASGAIFGLVGSYVAMERKGVNMLAAVVYAALIFLVSAGPGVNIFAHLFGALSGFALGLLFHAVGAKKEDI
jgi:rhomboid protease GluP